MLISCLFYEICHVSFVLLLMVRIFDVPIVNCIQMSSSMYCVKYQWDGKESLCTKYFGGFRGSHPSEFKNHISIIVFLVSNFTLLKIFTRSFFRTFFVLFLWNLGKLFKFARIFRHVIYSFCWKIELFTLSKHNTPLRSTN